MSTQVDTAQRIRLQSTKCSLRLSSGSTLTADQPGNRSSDRSLRDVSKNNTKLFELGDRAHQSEMSDFSVLTRSSTFPCIDTHDSRYPRPVTRQPFNLILPQSSRINCKPAKSYSQAQDQSKMESISTNSPDRTQHRLLSTRSSPPTPPEDPASLDWHSNELNQLSNRAASTGHVGDLAQAFNSVEVRSRYLPDITNQDSVPASLPRKCSTSNSSDWFDSAMNKIAASLASSLRSSCIEISSQVLPLEVKEPRLTPTFDRIVSRIQGSQIEQPYITITHAVAENAALKELPKSPPTTPHATGTADHYFANHQTVFTNAAIVPVYHGRGVDLSVGSGHHISAPLRTNITILERHIPPSTPDEIKDMFSIPLNRSYLADRLPELAIDTGSLLFVYPTKGGGQEFMRHFIGPVIDPVLRKYQILNQLSSEAARSLGSMKSVEVLPTYEEMQVNIQEICTYMNQTVGIRGPKSSFEIVHQEIARSSLAKESWLSWWIYQEQCRLQQTFVDHHNQGESYMDSERDRPEMTINMIARQFVEEIRKSPGANEERALEVGVFVIRRCAA